MVTIAWAVLCLLVAQRVTSAALARALPAEHAGSGRSCLRRVRRWWSGPALEQGLMSPALICLALPLLARDQSVVVAMDTTRLGPWAVWLAGIVIAGRTLPIGWTVIPYPWPKGRFRVTTLALIQQLQQAFPTGVGWTLVADRGLNRRRLRRDTVSIALAFPTLPSALAPHRASEMNRWVVFERHPFPLSMPC
jgi:hypothetical protein